MAIIPSTECQNQWGVAKFRLVEHFQIRRKRSIRGNKANLDGAFSKLKLLENITIRSRECNNDEGCQAFSFAQESLTGN